MYNLRLYIFVIFISSSLSAFSQSHDFVIKDFRENEMDMTAATSDIKDLRGLKPALIRFTVRDTLFSFSANNGILGVKRGIGEILLFIPDGTKRITVRHPSLGTLRDYVLPLPIKAKRTYDAEIAIQKEGWHEDKPVEEPAKETVEQPVSNEEPQSWDASTFYSTESESSVKTKFLLGGGYQAMGVAGPTALLGLEIGCFHISADYTFGMEKVEGVAIYYGDTFGEAYDYSVSRFSARLGINTSPNSAFQFVPQIGASFNIINGDKIAKNSSKDKFSKSNPISLSVGASFRLRLAKSLYLYATPQYDISISPDDTYKVLKDADNKIKGWGEGFCISAGLLLRL